MARSYKRDKIGRFASGGGGGSARKSIGGAGTSSTVRNGGGGTTSFQPKKPYRKLGENATNLGSKQTPKQSRLTERVGNQRRNDALAGSAKSGGAGGRGTKLGVETVGNKTRTVRTGEIFGTKRSGNKVTGTTISDRMAAKSGGASSRKLTGSSRSLNKTPLSAGKKPAAAANKPSKPEEVVSYPDWSKTTHSNKTNVGRANLARLRKLKAAAAKKRAGG